MTILLTGDPTLGGCSGKPKYCAGARCNRQHLPAAERQRIWDLTARLGERVQAALLPDEPLVATNGPGAASMLAWQLRSREPVKIAAKEAPIARLTVALSHHPVPGYDNDSYTWRVIQRQYEHTGLVVLADPLTERFHPVTGDTASKYMLNLRPEDVNWAKGDEQLDLFTDDPVHHQMYELRDGDPGFDMDLAIARARQGRNLDLVIKGGWIECAIPWDRYQYPEPKTTHEWPKHWHDLHLPGYARMECQHCRRYWLTDHKVGHVTPADNGSPMGTDRAPFLCPGCGQPAHWIAA